MKRAAAEAASLKYARTAAAGPAGRTSGGLFSLDGVHPTTVGYGILAQELIRVMELAGVKFYAPDGNVRQGLTHIDFSALLAEDSLLREPPPSFTSDLGLLGWLDRTADAIGLGRVALPTT